MSRNVFYFSLLVFCIMAISCDDIVEKNISKDKINLRLPALNDTTTAVNQTFWWDTLPGATSYQLMIVSPDMTNPQKLVVDTVISKNKFKLTLSDGRYEWCVKGINSGYESESSCRFLTIIQ